MIITLIINNSNSDPQELDPRPVRHVLGGTTCLPLLVYYGLLCFLRHYLPNTANWICYIILPRLKNTCVRQVVSDKRFLLKSAATSAKARVHMFKPLIIYIYIYIYAYVQTSTYTNQYKHVYMYIYIYIYKLLTSPELQGAPRSAGSPPTARPPARATWKHGWSKHGSSRIC